MPFISRYKLSNSSPLGFGPVVSMGIVEPSSNVTGWSSTTGEMIFGYLLDSHRKAAGMPILLIHAERKVGMLLRQVLQFSGRFSDVAKCYSPGSGGADASSSSGGRGEISIVQKNREIVRLLTDQVVALILWQRKRESLVKRALRSNLRLISEI